MRYPLLSGLLWILASGALLAERPAGANVDTAIRAEEAAQARARAAQDRIERLDDQTLEALNAYRSEQARLRDLDAYNRNLRDMLATQQSEEARIQKALGELEGVRRDIVPLMLEQLDTLAQFVALDLPFLPEERQQRVKALQEMMGRADVPIGEKYRRIAEAYQIEAEYGQSIEAWVGSVDIDGTPVTVDLFRLGRVALYYVTLDRSAAAIFDPVTRGWQALDGDAAAQVDLAVRVARKQAPPDLLTLPLPTGAKP